MEPLLPALICCFFAENGRTARHFAQAAAQRGQAWLFVRLALQAARLALAAFGGALILAAFPFPTRMTLAALCLCVAALIMPLFGRLQAMAARLVGKKGFGSALLPQPGDASQIVVIGIAGASLAPWTTFFGSLIGAAIAAALPFLLEGRTLRAMLRFENLGIALLLGGGLYGLFAV